MSNLHVIRDVNLPTLLCTYVIRDYGRPIKPFFIEMQNFWASADKFWDIWGIFCQTISTNFASHTVSPLFMFAINKPLFLQKTKPLYPNPKYIWDWDLNLGRK